METNNELSRDRAPHPSSVTYPFHSSVVSHQSTPLPSHHYCPVISRYSFLFCYLSSVIVHFSLRQSTRQISWDAVTPQIDSVAPVGRVLITDDHSWLTTVWGRDDKMDGRGPKMWACLQVWSTGLNNCLALRDLLSLKPICEILCFQWTVIRIALFLDGEPRYKRARIQ